MSDQFAPHTAVIRLRWSDFDRFGHVTNAAYIELAQEARVVWSNEEFSSPGHDIPAVFVRRLSVDYLRPVMPSASAVTVKTEVVRVGTSSFTTRQVISDPEGHECAVVETVQVAVDMRTAKPREITAQELKILTKGTRPEDA